MAIRQIISSIITAGCAVTAQPQATLVENGTLRIPRTPKDDTVLPMPSAAEMTRGGVVPTPGSNGAVSLSIPLYELRAGSLSQRIAISYQSNGIKADDDNCLLGLGWTLQSGGYIVRTIKARPDEDSAMRKFRLETDSRIARNGDVDYLRNVLHGNAEAELDRYSYSIGGYSGQFVIIDGNVVQLPRTDVEISLVGEKKDGVRDFAISTPDGARYRFASRERTVYRYSPAAVTVVAGALPPDYTAVTGWYLTEAVSGTDTIKYEYGETFQSRQEVTDKLYSVSMAYSAGTYTYGSDHPYMHSTAHIEQPDRKVPKAIRWRSGVILFDSDTLGAYKTICGFRIINTAGKEVRRISFEQSKFRDGRTRLASYGILGDGRLIDGKKFGYIDTPSSSSRKYKDFFGYSNADNGAIRVYNSILDMNLEPSATRAYHYPSAERGLLNAVTDATGAETKITYEPSTVSRGETDISIGVRIGSVSEKDPITGRQALRIYEYADAVATIDFGDVSVSDFLSTSGSLPDASSYTTGTAFTASCRIPGAGAEDAVIYYGTIAETVSGTGIDNPLKTVYSYDIGDVVHPFVHAWHGMPTGAETDAKYIGSKAHAEGADAATRLRILQAHPVKGYFKETIWKKAPLARKTVMAWRGGAYETEYEEIRHHTLVRDRETVAGLYAEGLTRTASTLHTVELREVYDGIGDINFFSVKIQSGRLYCDSIVSVRRYADGTRRRTVKRFRYNGREFLTAQPLSDTRSQGTYAGDFPTVTPIGEEMRGFTGCDSIMYDGRHTFLQAEETECGGRTVGIYRCYASNLSGNMFVGLRSDGYHGLPVIERYIVDGIDTIDVHMSYSRYGVGTGNVRKSGEKILHNSRLTHRRDYHAYDSRGNLIETSDNCGIVTSFLWGYGATLPVAAVEGGSYASFAGVAGIAEIERMGALPDAALESVVSRLRAVDSLKVTSYTHIPLVGCTSVTAPNRLAKSYAYSAGRLCGEYDPDGRMTKSYSYALYGESDKSYNKTEETGYRTADGSAYSSATVIYDGFGVPVAVTADETAGGGTGTVRASRYDAVGRVMAETAIAPVCGTYSYSDILSAARAFHGDYAAERVYGYYGTFAAAPVSVQECGDDVSGHIKSVTLHANSNTSERLRCVKYTISDDADMRIRRDGYYDDGELEVTESIDEDGGRILTFTDILGNTVLERRDMDNGLWADTRYLYSPAGLILAVLPPAVTEPSSDGVYVDAEDVDRYGYLYRYDSADRLCGRKQPGCEWERMLYDRTGRGILTQDGNQRRQGIWRFVLYDKFGRRCVGGTCNAGFDESVPGKIGITVVRDDNGPLMGYSLRCDGADFPLSGVSVTWADYYDDYRFIGHGGFPPSSGSRWAYVREEGFGECYAASANTMLTGAVRLAGEDRIFTVNYYDRRGRVIQSRSTNLLGGTDEIHTAYDFSDNPLRVKTVIRTMGKDGRSQVKLAETELAYAYDEAGRTVSVQVLRDGEKIPLHTYDYDGIGRLEKCNAPGVTVSSAYNIRGSVTSIDAGRLFSQTLHYADGLQPRYGGDPSRTEWRQGSFTGERPVAESYDYRYDAMGRLTEAAYSRGGGDADFSCTYGYDVMGNVTRLVRRGITEKISAGAGSVPVRTYGIIDDLTMEYDGNRLKSISDAAEALVYNGAADFRDGADEQAEYTYDACGSMTSDLNRGITEMVYDHNRLPCKVTFATGAELEYVYDSDGRKLRAVYRTPTILQPISNDTRVDYVGNAMLRNGEVEMVLLPDGFMRGDTIYTYVKDYLGNVRCVVREDGELCESNGYYPYGMSIPCGGDIQPYKYGGKEFERMHGIDLYDSRARWYDPALGRTTTMDPEAGTYPGLSPYLWCAANPVRFTDPSGRTISVMIGDEIYLYDYDNSCFVDSKGNQAQLTDEYSNYVLDALTVLRKGETGNEIVEYLSNDKNHNVFISQNNENSYDRNGEEYIINWNATSNMGGPSYFGIRNDKISRIRPAFIGLAHEMAHIQDLWQGTMDNSVWLVTESGYKVTKSEIYSCSIENKIRAEHNVPLRTHYVVYKGDVVAPYSTLFSPYCTLYMLQHSKK